MTKQYHGGGDLFKQDISHSFLLLSFITPERVELEKWDWSQNEEKAKILVMD